MKIVVDYFQELFQAAIQGWNRFWFAAISTDTLCVLRIFAGLMLLYSHAVWSLDLEGFFGSEGRLTTEFVKAYHYSNSGELGMQWSFLYGLDGASLWAVHILCLFVLLLFMLGFLTRITSIGAFLITVSYANRAAGSLFGLDQINAMLSMYLMLGPCGAKYSIDAIRKKSDRPDTKSVSANLSIRLIQVHLCVVYFFAAIGKMLGETWWRGDALWGAFANYEYQTIDMTWLAGFPLIINALSQFTVLWELFYVVLIWPRLTRPLMVGLAVPLHLGIAYCMGMITFGLVMLMANFAFVSPELVKKVLSRRKT